MNKNQTRFAILSIFIAAALIGTTITIGDNMVSATNKKSNEALQDLEQSSTTGQSSSCFSENGTSLASCNNVDASFNLNLGNNGLGQK